MSDFDFSHFATPVVRSKSNDLMTFLDRLDRDSAMQRRVDYLAQGVSNRLSTVKMTAPTINGKSTNPFVLAAFAQAKGLTAAFELDMRLAAAKEFSSLETALGRVVEDVVPQVYGWEKVETEGHSPLSEIDCAKLVGDTIKLSALKSGPACVNDTMVHQIGTAIASHCMTWANHWNVPNVEFTVGMNYSTAKNSNKKDWHAIRLAEMQLSGQAGVRIVQSCVQSGVRVSSRALAVPEFKAVVNGINLRVSTRQGIGLWDYIAAPLTDAYLEICAGLVLGAIPNAAASGDFNQLTTRNLSDVLRLPAAKLVKTNSVLSPAHLEWFFLFARHFVDELKE